MTWQELAERVERSEPRCDQLDAEIEVMLQRPRWPDAAVVKLGKRPAPAASKGPGRGWRRWGVFFQRYSYTGSLDAAMLLVPEGWTVWALRQDWAGWWAGLERRNKIEGGWGPTPSAALALTAAALRAHAAQAIEAAEAGETRSGSTEGESAVPAGDAPQGHQP